MRPKRGGPEKVGLLLKDTLERIDELFNTKGSLTGLTTGYLDLDKKTAGLQDSDLILVMRSSLIGKAKRPRLGRVH